MVSIRCPECEMLLECPSTSFGNQLRCAACATVFMPDTAHLAKFTLPDSLTVELRTSDGHLFTGHHIPVVAEYGYLLPPLLTSGEGRLELTKEMFQRAEKEQLDAGLMDRKGDYSLNRYVRLRIMSGDEGREAGRLRLASGWPPTDFEKAFYGSIESLADAYVSEVKVKASETRVDLAFAVDHAIAILTVALDE